MKEENKVFMNPSVLSSRVDKALQCRQMTRDELYNIITEKVGYKITKTNYRTSFDKIPNINYLMVLSKALNVSIEYLVGMEEEALLDSGLEQNTESRKYQKYNGEYFFYFLPTVSNGHEELCVANLSIQDTTVCMTIATDNSEKKYVGKLQLSKTYSIGYINLIGRGFGEIVNLSFCDPVINAPASNIEFLIGAMLSISSGDFKRTPVFSRFILSNKKVDVSKHDAIRANLLLNTKYITIEREKIIEVIKKLELNRKNEEIIRRLVSAFPEKGYYVIEESFIINTLQRDYNLTFEKTMALLDTIRLNSMTDANSKINKSLDARLHNYIYIDNTEKNSSH